MMYFKKTVTKFTEMILEKKVSLYFWFEHYCEPFFFKKKLLTVLIWVYIQIVKVLMICTQNFFRSLCVCVCVYMYVCLYINKNFRLFYLNGQMIFGRRTKYEISVWTLLTCT